MEPGELEREIERLHPKSFGWALACCSWDRQEADDVLQTAYLKVLDGSGFDGRSTVKTWLFAIIRKTAIDRRRRQWAARLGLARLLGSDINPRTADPIDAAAENPNPARLRVALAGLAARQREVLDLVFFHDLTIEQAAGIMRISVGAARVHYQRGKQQLRKRMG